MIQNDGDTGIDTAKVRKEWEMQRNRHPMFGEGTPAADISRLWDESAARYSANRYRLIVSDITDYLVSKRYLSGSVLDIGCGPGAFAIPFSDTAEKVYALDASRPMLDRLMKDCEKECVNNVVPVYADCREIPAELNCDLAFTSLCPPMNCPEALLEMERHGKVCAYASSVNTEGNIETEIWNALGKDYSYCGYNTSYPFAYLKSIGRDPELIVFSQDNVSVEPEGAAVKRYKAVISQYRPLTSGIEDVIADVVSGHSENGKVICASTMKIGLLIWSR